MPADIPVRQHAKALNMEYILITQGSNNAYVSPHIQQLFNISKENRMQEDFPLTMKAEVM